MESKLEGNERARCYQESSFNDKLPVRSFYFFSEFVAEVGEACPSRVGFLVSTICSLITLVGGGRWNDNLCTNLATAKKYNSEGMKSFHMPIHLLSSPPGTQQVDISGNNTVRLMSAPHGLNQRWSITNTLLFERYMCKIWLLNVILMCF